MAGGQPTDYRLSFFVQKKRAVPTKSMVLTSGQLVAGLKTDEHHLNIVSTFRPCYTKHNPLNNLRRLT